MIRPLDSWESYFFRLNEQVPTHFVMAASIRKTVHDSRWLEAFRLLQERHILLRAGIHENENGQLIFVEDASHSTPVTFLARATEEELKQCYAEQVHTAFPQDAEALIRVYILRDAEQTDLVIACHHSISDAMGMALLIRDAINVANGHALAAAPSFIPPSADTLWQERRPGLKPLDLPPSDPGPGRRYMKEVSQLPTVATVTLTIPETVALRETAGRWKVSVHAVLCAALALAGSELELAWRASPVRIATPVDLRDRFGLRDEVCLAITAFGHTYEHSEGRSLHAAAVNIQKVLATATTDEALYTATIGLAALMQVEPGADLVQRLVDFSPAYEMMVSNLRVLNLELGAGPLRLQAIWGPNNLSRFEGQQSVGASTFANRLSLTYVSYSPFPGFLDRAADILRSLA